MTRTALLLAVGSLTILPAKAEPVVTRLAFGSCCQQSRPMPIFDAVSRFEPQVWIWMGDNIYGDTTDMAIMAAKYAKLLSNEKYSGLRKKCSVIGTWDDHDYGKNDAGKEFSQKVASQQHFLDFLGVPPDDLRRKQAGVYTSHSLGTEGKQIKVILLDTRYHRDPLGSDGDVLGEMQWDWLTKELEKSTAQIHLLISSIQLVASDHRFEKWGNFPKEKKRLMTLLARPDIPPVTVLSGDRHLAEISVEKATLPYALYDITSSSLNKPLGREDTEVNRHRVGKEFRKANFGTLEVDWSTTPPTLSFALRNIDGAALRRVEVRQSR